MEDDYEDLEEKPFFKIRYDDLITFTGHMTNEELGDLFRFMIFYAEDGEGATNFDTSAARGAFGLLEDALIHDLQANEERKRNREKARAARLKNR